SLTVGDIIANIRRSDGGWWEGELHGRRGLFPDNFVREIKKDSKRDGGQANVIKSDLSNGRASPVSDSSIRPGRKGEQIRKRRCKAAFSYLPQHEDELELKIGDVIEIIAEVEEGWWEGYLNGKTGMFPSNFTKEIIPESDAPSVDTSTSQEELRGGRTSESHDKNRATVQILTDLSVCLVRCVGKDSPGSESDGGDSRSDTGSAEIQPKKIRGFGFGDIFKDQPIKLRPRSMDADSEADKVRRAHAHGQTMKTESDSRAKGREQCKVLFPYEAQNEDELSIKEGDIVNIITKDCADAGWWMGEVGGRQGVFPDNFVKLLEVEKEVSVAALQAEDSGHLPHPLALPSRSCVCLSVFLYLYLYLCEEVKVGDIPKPSLPSILPKKPLPPKTSSSSSFPPRRPERPPTLACESPKSEAVVCVSADVDLDAVVSSTDKLSHPTASRPRVTDRRPRSQIFTPVSLFVIGSSGRTSLCSISNPLRKDRGKEEPESVSRPADASLRKVVPIISAPESKAPLPPKPSVLNPPNAGHRPASPSSSSGLTPSPELRHSPMTPPTLEELKSQLRDLRASVELLKSQHRQEMKQLSNALDEEKRIRLSLQMEVEHIKKSLCK
uniref:Osteoclast-stimulating factor 1 n=1 Tax=Mola mola TaxID=94237 RepID=A0A3Q3VR96_MOLML